MRAWQERFELEEGGAGDEVGGEREGGPEKQAEWTRFAGKFAGSEIGDGECGEETDEECPFHHKTESAAEEKVADTDGKERKRGKASSRGGRGEKRDEGWASFEIRGRRDRSCADGGDEGQLIHDRKRNGPREDKVIGQSSQQRGGDQPKNESRGPKCSKSDALVA